MYYKSMPMIKNFRFQISDFKLKDGFTIIEILVVIAVLSVIAVIFTEIFLRSVRGNNKAQLISKMKQEGQAALALFDTTLRNAEVIICPFLPVSGGESSSQTLIVKNGDGYIRVKFKDPMPVDNPTVNGYIYQDSATECDAVDPVTPLSVIDSGSTGVSISNGEFIRTKSPGYPDILNISFTVNPGVGWQKAVASTIDPVEFKTTIRLRL